MTIQMRRLNWLQRLGAVTLMTLPLSIACGDGESTEEPKGQVQQSVHDDGVFELEGNVADDPGTAGQDWSSALFGGSSAIAHTGVVSDPGDVSIFTQGGSKDVNDVSQWRHRDGSVPDKDNITNAYAAAYLHLGDLIIYFGADRFATNGDAAIGFWFFKDEVDLGPSGTFTGNHTDGDILVLSEFTQGGAIGTIAVYEWEGGINGELQPVPNGSGTVLGNGTDVFCLPTDTACASINKVDVPSPWNYVPKSGTEDSFAPGAFFEGGINISDLVPGDTCFSSFLAETRSSTSTTATLKDFVVHEFDTCSISVTKTCEVTALNPAGSTHLFTASFAATVTNDSASALPTGTVITIVDDASTPNDTSDDVTDSVTLAAPLAAGASVNFSGTFQTNSNPPMQNIVTATAVFGTNTIQAETAPTACTALPLDASLAVCKSCNTELVVDGGVVQVGVDFEGTVCNTGDVPLSVSAEDSNAGAVTLSDSSLGVGECATFSGSYLPSSSSADPLEALFTDTVTATGSNPALTSDVTAMDSASCGLCAVENACPTSLE